MRSTAGNTITLIGVALLLLTAVFVWRLSSDKEFFSQFINKESFVGTTITIHGTRISVQVADTESLRVRGLSGQASLPYGTGLLMKFSEDGYPGIWMKDMDFPIDIVWIDKDLKVIEVTSSVGPETYPKVFYPTNPVRYILELPAGFSDIHNIEAGNSVEY